MLYWIETLEPNFNHKYYINPLDLLFLPTSAALDLTQDIVGSYLLSTTKCDNNDDYGDAQGRQQQLPKECL